MWLTCVNAVAVQICFLLSMLRNRAPVMDDRVMTQTTAAPAKAVVLVIDDDPAVRNSLKFALEIEGFSVRVYPTGAALLAKDDMPASGCLVTDYNLPGMNGLDLLDLLRQRNIKWPAILITTHPTAVIRKRAAAAGVRLIEKPLLSDTLFHSIRSALSWQPLERIPVI
jgi:two-component system, LuxR family, response regulator FixJ